MLRYVVNAIKRFHHKHPQKPQDQPYPHIKIIYRSKTQYSPNADNSPVLTSDDKIFSQEVNGTFLHCARAVNATILTALGSIATQQANLTENTIKKVT